MWLYSIARRIIMFSLLLASLSNDVDAFLFVFCIFLMWPSCRKVRKMIETFITSHNRTLLMSHTLFLIAAITIFSMSSIPSTYEADYSGVKVMVIGTHHFVPSGQDVYNISVNDIHTAKRQAEILALVQRMETFKPTKIAVELTLEHEAAFNKDYADYIDGKYTLSGNEREQLGMRLAARLGHKKLYAVDAITSWSMEALDEASVAGNEESLLQYVLQTKVPKLLKDVQDLENSDAATVTDILKYLNSDWYKRKHSVYGLLARVGTRDNHAGAELAGSWYLRNLKIAANIQDIIEKDNERVLVLFGAAHRMPIEKGLMDMGIPVVDPTTEIFQE